MLRKILTGSDLTEASDTAIMSGRALASAVGAELHLLHCVSRSAGPLLQGPRSRAAVEASVAEAEPRLAAQVRRVGGAAPDGMRVTAGQPAREITRRASELDADLIVLGAHRPRPMLDTLLGGTADRVIRMAKVPCLVSNRQVQRLRSVLVPVDLSATSRTALRFAVGSLAPALAASGDGGAELVVLFVSSFASPHDRKVRLTPRLEKLADEARATVPVGVAVSHRVRSAPLPLDGIGEVADEWNPDLIVMGTHGYSGLARALIGSVALGAARSLRHPVVLVPPQRRG